MEEEQIDFKLEAEAVIADIGFAVKSISLSTKLPSSRECVFLNVLTKECQSMCIELSILGFRVVGDSFDDNQEERVSKYYETIYALLDSLSPGYSQSFGEALARKLSLLDQAVVDGDANSNVSDEKTSEKTAS